jgi:hypothetical protein
MPVSEPPSQSISVDKRSHGLTATLTIQDKKQAFEFTFVAPSIVFPVSVRSNNETSKIGKRDVPMPVIDHLETEHDIEIIER